MTSNRKYLLMIPLLLIFCLITYIVTVKTNSVVYTLLVTSILNIISILSGILFYRTMNKKRMELLAEETKNFQLNRGSSLKDSISKKSSISSITESTYRLQNDIFDFIKRFKSFSQQSQNIGNKLSDNTDDSLKKVKEIVSTLELVKGESDNLDLNIQSVDNSVTKIFSDFNILNDQISNQNISLSRSSSAIEEMSASTESVLRITKDKNLATTKLLELTNIGGDKLRFTDSIIEDISQQTDEMLQMITLIDDVASRTNLLAINASIEAAHAGESGKGFAVVANEIRKLAENTSINANRISETLNQITSKIIDAKDASKESSDTFNQILIQTKDVSNGLVEVAQNMEELSIGEKLILESTSELLDSSHQIDDRSTSIKERIGSIEEKMSSVKNISSKSTKEIHNIHNHSIELNKIFLQGSTYLNQSLLNSESLNRELKEFKNIEIDETDEVKVGISWNDNLSVKNSSIDNQHRSLINGINDFLHSMVDGSDENIVEKMLNKLGDYVVTHFKDEEDYLERIGYPDLESHKLIHKNFVDRLTELKNQYLSEGSSAILAAAIQKDVAQWLLEHISKEDMKYSEYKTGK